MVDSNFTGQNRYTQPPPELSLPFFSPSSPANSHSPSASLLPSPHLRHRHSPPCLRTSPVSMENPPPETPLLPLPPPPLASLPLPPPPPIYLPLPATEAPPHPPQTPPRTQPTPSHGVPMIIRALASSSVGVAARKAAVALAKQLWSDPKRLWDWRSWLLAAFKERLPPPPHRPLPPPLLPPRPEFPDLLHMLNCLATSEHAERVIIISAIVLLLLHAGRVQEEEDPLPPHRLPDFVRHGVGELVGLRRQPPLRPLRIPTALVLAASARSVDVKQMPRKDGLLSAPTATSSAVHNSEVNFGKKSRERFLRALQKASVECKASTDPADMRSMKACTAIEEFKDLFSKFDAGILQRNRSDYEKEKLQRKDKARLSELDETVKEKIAEAEGDEQFKRRH